MRRVVITGMGAVCALGNTLPESLSRALGGASGVRRCDERLWGEYGGFEATRPAPAKRADAYDPATLFALAAAAEALDDSSLRMDAAQRERAGSVIGCAGAGQQVWHRCLHAAFVEGAAHRAGASVALQQSGNIFAGLLALRHGLRGPSLGLANACASGAASIALAADMIRSGRADVMLAGGTEAPIGLHTYGSMLSAGAMRPTDDPDEACCPFDARRAGLVMGEGAAVVVLESAEAAAARGATIRGELLGDAMTNDAHHVYSPEPTGASWARVAAMALERAGLGPADVGAISAHAASTHLGDRVETRAIKRLLGARAPEVPVTATKSQVGHALGAAGAIELVLALAALNRGWLLPTINHREPDPDCDLDCVPNEARPTDAEILLKQSFGFVGTNCALVVQRGQR